MRNILLILFLVLITCCSNTPKNGTDSSGVNSSGGNGGGNGGGGGGGNNPTNVNTNSVIVHPAILSIPNSTPRNIYLIYMASDCNLQTAAAVNMAQLPVNNLGSFPYDMANTNDIILVYLDLTHNYANFPSWMTPGGLFIKNRSRTNTGLPAMDYFDRVFMPADQDAVNVNTLFEILKYVQTNFNVLDGVGNPSGAVRLILWGHGGGWEPVSGSSSFSVGQDVTPYKGYTGKDRAINYSFGSSDTTLKSLSDDEITWAVMGTIKTVGFLGYDACFMGNLETYYGMLRRGYNAGNGGILSGAFLGSPGAEANAGYDYSHIYEGANGLSANMPSGVNVNRYITYGSKMTDMFNALDSFFQDIYYSSEYQKFYITNLVKAYNPARNSPNGENPDFTHRTYNYYYVAMQDLLRDFSSAYGGNFTTYLNTYNTWLNAGFGSSAGMWLPLWPKHFYQSYWTNWHSVANVALLRDHPLIANVLTNSAIASTPNALGLFISQSTWLWSTVNNSPSGGYVPTGANYIANYLNQQNSDESINTALYLTPTIIARTNVAYITGLGQSDWYKFVVQTAGTVKLRISSFDPENQGKITTVVLYNSSMGVIQSFTNTDFTTSTDPTGLAIKQGVAGSCDQIHTEFGNMKKVDINQTLSVGTYYINICALSQWDYKNGMVEMPYLIFPKGPMTAVFQ